MYKINLDVSETREVVLSSASGGTTGENNSVVLNFRIPSAYSAFNKYLDIYKEDGKKTQTVISVYDEKEFSYILPGELSDNLNLYMQLVFKKDKTVFKSYKFVLTFEESINATGYLESEYKDSIQTLFETKADKTALSEVSSKLSDKLPYGVYTEDKNILVKMINQKTDKEYTEKALELKADKNKVEASLLLKADKTETKELKQLIEDNARTTKESYANCVISSASGYKINIDDVSPYAHTIKGILTPVNNIIPYPFPAKVYTNDGITLVMNDSDRSIIINGTPTRTIGLNVFEGEAELDGTYVLSGINNDDGDLTPTMQPVVDGIWQNVARYSPYEYEFKGTLNRITLYLSKGVTYTDEVITPCLVKKDESYEVDMSEVVITSNGKKYYPHEDGSFEMQSVYPEMTFETNNPKLRISVSYNRDMVKALDKKADLTEIKRLWATLNELKSQISV